MGWGSCCLDSAVVTSRGPLRAVTRTTGRHGDEESVTCQVAVDDLTSVSGLRRLLTSSQS